MGWSRRLNKVGGREGLSIPRRKTPLMYCGHVELRHPRNDRVQRFNYDVDEGYCAWCVNFLDEE